MENLSDSELIRQIANGETGALEHLINRHYLTVYKAAYRYCGIKEDAEDIAQEVFIKVARSLVNFKGDSSFVTWLYRIAINAAKDHHRSASAKSAREAVYLEVKKLISGGGHDNRVSSEKMYVAINKLPPKQKDAILLVFAEGMNHKEAAAVLKCAETTISWRIFQARGRLKKLLKYEV